MRFGSKAPLVSGRASRWSRSSCWRSPTPPTGRSTCPRVLLGIGVGFSFASMANLIVEAVRPDQTGVATGMNAVMRTIGGAIGGQVVASLLAATLSPRGFRARTATRCRSR